MIQNHSAKDSVELTMYMHPQGWYLAVLNKYMDKKKEKFCIELFETKEMKVDEVPNQKILIKDSVTNVEREI